MSAGWAEGAVLGGGSRELGAIKVEKCNGDYLVQWNQGRKHAVPGQRVEFLRYNQKQGLQTQNGEWMNEQMDGQTDGWMDGYVDGQRAVWADRRTDGQAEWMDVKMGGWTDGWTENEWVDGRTDGRGDRQADGWVERWAVRFAARRTDGRGDGRTDRRIRLGRHPGT